ncbi:MAG: DUF881 domain-containing protein [Tetrasphaera sp.]|nr:DUF881 domain-containing protein [Tetrasphaera sp.]
MGSLLAVAAIILGSGISRDGDGPRRPDLAHESRQRTEVETTTAAIAATETQISALERAARDWAQQGSAADKVARPLKRCSAQTPWIGPGLVVSPPTTRARDRGTFAQRSSTASPRISLTSDAVLSDVVSVADRPMGGRAEAIAVDGQRLSSRTAIRLAGDAIRLNGGPLVPPYRIQAIGGP